MTQRRFVKLPKSGIIISPEDVLFIGRADLNKYHVFLRVQSVAMPTVEGEDADVLARELDAKESLVTA